MAEIDTQSENYLLNVNQEDFLEYLETQHRIQPIHICEEGLSVSTHTEMIPAEHHSFNYFVEPGESYERDVIRYHLPFDGDPQLLRVQPSTWLSNHPLVRLHNNEILFDIVNFSLSSEQIKQEAEKTLGTIRTLASNLNKDIENFNARIREEAAKRFDQKKDEILKKNDLVSSLGVPVRKVEGVPETFSLPVKRKVTTSPAEKPAVYDQSFRPEPTLDETIYRQILQFIHDVGKQFERHPRTYSEKDEEALRDHFLLILEPNFQGSATGETFNKAGKTDILMRHEGHNIFVAELKFWRGEKAYFETVTQLLKYLTWRDSKAAVIIFVRNKELSPVLHTIKDKTPLHSNYLRYVSEIQEGWYQYIFHIPNDRNREVRVAVMTFHLPTAGE